MGYSINVNTQSLDKCTKKIDNYLNQTRIKMKSLDNSINSSVEYWEGTDQMKFIGQWQQVRERNSIISELDNSLESYSNFIKHAKNEYDNAQSRANNRASHLPR